MSAIAAVCYMPAGLDALQIASTYSSIAVHGSSPITCIRNGEIVEEGTNYGQTSRHTKF